MTDYIHICNLRLHGNHGVLPEENALGQKFYIDADCALDLREAGGSDNFSTSVCYAELCELMASISHNNTFHLIEAFAEKIASTILLQYSRITSVKITIRKPNAPVMMAFDYVGVTITRSREST